MSEIKGQFEATLLNEVNKHVEEIAAATRRRPLDAGSQLMDIIVRVAKQIGLDKIKEMKKADVVEIVGRIYDDYVAKIDLPGQFDPLIHMALKQVVLMLTAAAYDRLVAA